MHSADTFGVVSLEVLQFQFRDHEHSMGTGTKPNMFSAVLRTALALLLVAPTLGYAASGRQGWVRAHEGQIASKPIAQATVTFVKQDGSAAFKTTTSMKGNYFVSLPPGRYYVRASHVDYEDYSSAPGATSVSADAMGTLNISLRLPAVTTVVIVRHAEKQNPQGSDPSEPLSDDGGYARRSCETRYCRQASLQCTSTDMTRTKETVKPYAKKFHLQTQLYAYGSEAQLAQTVLTKHRGDRVLVAAHSDTVANVANALGAQVPPDTIGDYDNLYVVSVGTGTASGVNLQYGEDSPDNHEKNDQRAMTVLLVGNTAGAPFGTQGLRHIVHKAGIGTIYTAGFNPVLTSLATALGLTPEVYNGSDLPGFAAQITEGHPQDTILVVGTNEQVRTLAQQLGAPSLPTLYPKGIRQIVVLTRFSSGTTRALTLRY